MEQPQNVLEWYNANKQDFQPPICNKLMFKNQLSIMFVGGPNTREDFHLNPSSEFYYMLKGNMELVVIDGGRRRAIPIREGQMFCLPAGVPHSPQRPEATSLGLVVERKRYRGELDGLRWYTDFKSCDTPLWERLFQCNDLGKDLVPVVNAFKASDQIATRNPLPELAPGGPGSGFNQNFTANIAPPIDFGPWLDKHMDLILEQGSLDVYDLAPSLEFSVRVVAHSSGNTLRYPVDTWVYQLRGSCTVAASSAPDDEDTAGSSSSSDEEEMEKFVIREGACMTIPALTPFRHISGECTGGGVQDDSSAANIALSLVVQQHPQVAGSIDRSVELAERVSTGTSTTAVNQNSPGMELGREAQVIVDEPATSATYSQARI